MNDDSAELAAMLAALPESERARVRDQLEKRARAKPPRRAGVTPKPALVGVCEKDDRTYINVYRVPQKAGLLVASPGKIENDVAGLVPVKDGPDWRLWWYCMRCYTGYKVTPEAIRTALRHRKTRMVGLSQASALRLDDPDGDYLEERRPLLKHERGGKLSQTRHIFAPGPIEVVRPRSN